MLARPSEATAENIQSNKYKHLKRTLPRRLYENGHFPLPGKCLNIHLALSLWNKVPGKLSRPALTGLLKTRSFMVRLMRSISAHMFIIPENGRTFRFTPLQSPCPMCQSAIEWCGIQNVFYGTSIPYLKQLGWKQIDIRAEEVARRAPFRKTKVVGGILEAECNDLFETIKKASWE